MTECKYHDLEPSSSWHHTLSYTSVCTRNGATFGLSEYWKHYERVLTCRVCGVSCMESFEVQEHNEDNS